MTTMTSEDLRAIITPAVEADLKAAGLWPTRDGLQMLLPVPNEPNLSCGYASKDLFLWCHPDDAHAQIERRLVEWMLNTHRHNISKSPGTRANPYVVMHYGDDHIYVYTGPTLLHSMLAAFAGRSKA